ncbi:hypothetical protein [Clostridium algidicarnis]|uniref:hypothetical protein n=1 Tax=Clostridium algidicarnis TaxID=37659 RepID=UPI001C0B6F6B|nr:hypothetical protein [Clostridium algidicarnis]MBU3193454.1 hypothetical protein [Clostridium algidicarnis]MBU3203141.1 hypothetical protein [Clostridium algidicarnis]MBU3211295.1 hypothetical protein [Clostridium algidicarnis]MBU3222197.1 hypothetical protein [Clostridium algidicarnis]
MAKKNILIKKKNDGKEWDELYPITTASNVKCSDGKDVESTLLEKAKESDTTRLTKNKTVTGAINELFTSVSDDTKSITKINLQLGDITKVPTTAKTVTGAISELFTSASDGKNLVANAVTNKGVVASASDTFSSLATKIGKISTGKKYSRGSDTFGVNFKPYNRQLNVSSLGFKPGLILIEHRRARSSRNFHKLYLTLNSYPFNTRVGCILNVINEECSIDSARSLIIINENGFSTQLAGESIDAESEDLVTWMAIE